MGMWGTRGHSSAGRALPSHGRGPGFNSPWFHAARVPNRVTALFGVMAQLVEHCLCTAAVRGSNPRGSTAPPAMARRRNCGCSSAGERRLAKAKAAGSIPVVRSMPLVGMWPVSRSAKC